MELLKDIPCNIEVCYITRAYFTRHGAGSFPTECDKSKINKDIEDNTNIYNDYQQTIRYGLFDKDEFFNRVESDRQTVISKCNISKWKNDFKFSLFVSHLNYTNNEIAGNCTLKELSRYFNKLYLSNTKYAEDVKIY